TTNVSWSNITSPTAKDWIGLYSSPDATDAGFVAWQYTNGGATGNVSFAVPGSSPTGSAYQFRLFANDGFTKLAASGPITVTSPPTPPPCPAAHAPRCRGRGSPHRPQRIGSGCTAIPRATPRSSPGSTPAGAPRAHGPSPCPRASRPRLTTSSACSPTMASLG